MDYRVVLARTPTEIDAILSVARIPGRGDRVIPRGSGTILIFEDGSVEFSVEWEGSTEPVATRLAIQPVVPLESLLPEGTPAP